MYGAALVCACPPPRPLLSPPPEKVIIEPAPGSGRTTRTQTYACSGQSEATGSFHNFNYNFVVMRLFGYRRREFVLDARRCEDCMVANLDFTRGFHSACELLFVSHPWNRNHFAHELRFHSASLPTFIFITQNEFDRSRYFTVPRFLPSISLVNK
jgi:hypothetical protein